MEVWTDTISKEACNKHVAKVQSTGALQVSLAYRTFPKLTVIAIAEVLPVVVLAKEYKSTCKHKGENSRELAARAEQEDSLNDSSLAKTSLSAT